MYRCATCHRVHSTPDCCSRTFHVVQPPGHRPRQVALPEPPRKPAGQAREVERPVQYTEYWRGR